VSHSVTAANLKEKAPAITRALIREALLADQNLSVNSLTENLIGWFMIL